MINAYVALRLHVTPLFLVLDKGGGYNNRGGTPPEQ